MALSGNAQNSLAIALGQEGAAAAICDAIDANTIKTSINAVQAAAIVANTAKTSYSDAAAVALNTAKTSYADAAAVTLNTAKTSMPTIDITTSAVTVTTAAIARRFDELVTAMVADGHAA
jgi:hypothetical protein